MIHIDSKRLVEIKQNLNLLLICFSGRELKKKSSIEDTVFKLIVAGFVVFIVLAVIFFLLIVLGVNAALPP
jgi:hypothetical protein